MEETKLLASAAVFRALSDEKKDLYDVLSEFIKEVINKQKLSSFNSVECGHFLQDEFGFRIPEAVLKSCLRNRLVKTGEITNNKGLFSVTSSFKCAPDIEINLNEARSDYEDIIEQLYQFVSNRGLIHVNRVSLASDFEDYLIQPLKFNNYTKDIAQFILLNQSNDLFKEKIGKIEEGLILYTGIQYSPELSTLGSWRGNLSIYLDIEHLFNAVGYNGNLYRKIFSDFFELVKEANRKKSGGRIELKYLEETEQEINNFFSAAVHRLSKREKIDPSKTAMINIVNGCNTRVDILEKKAKFKKELEHLNITVEKTTNYYSDVKFNIESESLIRELFETNSKSGVSERDIASVLKIFTKINYHRKGINQTSIDKVSAFFLTGSRLPLKLSFSPKILDKEGSIPFATNIDFLTEKLWFKLNKGFGGKGSRPSSFDSVIRAKIILSSQVRKSISSHYRELTEKYSIGEIDKDILAYMFHEMSESPRNPDDFTLDEESILSDVLNDDFIQKTIKEKSILEKSAIEGKAAIEEIKLRDYRDRVSLRAPLKKVARRQLLLLKGLSFFVLPIFIVSWLIQSISISDSTWSIITGVITLLYSIPLVRYKKALTKSFWRMSKNWYRKKLNKLN